MSTYKTISLLKRYAAKKLLAEPQRQLLTSEWSALVAITKHSTQLSNTLITLVRRHHITSPQARGFSVQSAEKNSEAVITKVKSAFLLLAHFMELPLEEIEALHHAIESDVQHIVKENSDQ
ncbi:MAG TPA: hypothetical protein VG621_03280 [Candidatus Paceibacterota bacterium]|nr:hypothetical protein [Candidatus Paceibacterota bacterium]